MRRAIICLVESDRKKVACGVGPAKLSEMKIIQFKIGEDSNQYLMM